MSSLKLIGVLLDYPSDELWRHGDELAAAVRIAPLSETQRAKLDHFVRDLLACDPLAAQDRWLSLFDRGRAMSLLLFEHIHGESRDRGQAMVDLIETYRRNGFELASRELPDYLPLVLEYLAQRPQDEARDWLHHLSHILALLAARAQERQSPYALLFELLIDYAEGTADLAVLRKRARTEPRDDTPEAMDRLWEEEAVRFGVDPPDASCSPSAGAPERQAASRQVQP